MEGIDKETCIKIRCPFVAKEDVDDREGTIIPKGTCLRAYMKRIPKSKLCRINPLIEIKTK